MRNPDRDIVLRAIGCCSEFEAGPFLGDILVDGVKGLTSLKTDPADLDSKARRYELIESVRAGKHVELAVTARTFRQSKGKMNRRYLRLEGDLAAQVPTFAKQPFLVDHSTWSQSERKGTILTSKLIEETQTRVAFEMAYLAVKPDAVISTLDGTLDRFSIGWFSLGPVLCTVHECDVRLSGSCDCWPGENVLVDGETKIAEYAYQLWSGKELSGVNIPAVQHTNIEDIQAALTAELNLPPKRTRTKHKENTMAFHRLAAALGLAVLGEGDEDRALAAVEALSRRATEAEQNLASTRTRLSQAEGALQLATSAASKVQIDAAIQRLYDEGKLRMDRTDPVAPRASAREARLRKIAAGGGNLTQGLADLAAEAAEMDVVVPVGQRLQSGAVGEPERRSPYSADLTVDNPYIRNVAAQLGLKPEDMVAFDSGHMIGGD